MNRNLLLGLAAAGLFTVALLGSALAADAMRDDGSGNLTIPGTSPDPIPQLPADDVTGVIDPESPLAGEPMYREIEVGGEFARIADAPPIDEDGDGLPPGGPSGGDELPVSDSSPPDADDRGYPWDVTELEAPIEEMLFPDLGFSFLRWLDFCADNPGADGCPSGVGGTILMPVDDHLAVGEFRLRNQLYTSRQGWWSCSPPADLGEDDYFLMLVANHPARMEIDYYPIDEPAAVQSVVVDHTSATDPEFANFLATVMDTGFPPGTGVHHCFVLHGDARARPYTIEVHATSFTGEVAADDYGFTTHDRRGRPPVTIAPVNGYEATVIVPVRSDPRSSSLLRLIPQDEAADCTSIEDAVLNRERRDVVPEEPGRPYSGYSGREEIEAELLASADWLYDSSYDANEIWTLSLREGTAYQMCIWWLQTAGTRSFDPASASVVERESQWIATPDRLRVAIEVAGILAPSSQGVGPESFVIRARSHCRWLQLPLERIEAGDAAFLGGLRFCDFGGYSQPDVTEIEVEFTDGFVKEFAIATPGRGEPRIEQVVLDLSTERASGLCGSSFGSCDPPTTVVPGARVHLDVVFYEEGPAFGSGWQRGSTVAFPPPPREPEPLPEQIRIDGFSSVIEAAGRDAVMVTANFDRPVTLRAYIEGDTAEQCFTGPVPEYASTTMTARHSFRLGGLCTLTSYLVGLEATDAAGTTTRFTRFPPPGSDAYPWFATAFTDGYHVSYQVTYQTSLVSDFETGWFNADVAGRHHSLRSESRCLVTFSPMPFREGLWGDTVEVEVHIRIGDGIRADGVCDTPWGFRWWEGSVVTSFTIDEFMAGPIRVPLRLEPLDGGSDLSSAVTLVIQGSVAP
ncbi:MAG TPA: hypothetical protein VK960_05130 [Acidimicrobiia bacterium]|nr:hypothetical protein [Acidimicrobiia bacterium]